MTFSLDPKTRRKKEGKKSIFFFLPLLLLLLSLRLRCRGLLLLLLPLPRDAVDHVGPAGGADTPRVSAASVVPYAVPAAADAAQGFLDRLHRLEPGLGPAAQRHGAARADAVCVCVSGISVCVCISAGTGT